MTSPLTRSACKPRPPRNWIATPAVVRSDRYGRPMSGLEFAVAELARAEGIELVPGRAVPWLSGRGHLNALVQSAAAASTIAALGRIHEELGGDAALLAAKRAGKSPTPDLIHVPTGSIVEVDEVQHFTSARERSLGLYPTDSELAFKMSDYFAVIATWRSKADRAFAHKTSSDFPSSGGRQAQRAYNDSLRDLLAPTFTGHPIVRLAVPDRSLTGVAERLARALPQT